MHTEKITIWGLVQGVGFRPFAAKLAHSMGLGGEIRNTGGIVEIWLNGTEEGIGAFLRALSEGLPPPAEIVHYRREALAEGRDFDGFSISESGEGGDGAALLPADLAVCDDCLAELEDPENPRWMHPFISCMSCGPRYTIIDRLPYDRANTSMREFHMCAACGAEYTDRDSRRYHAQTISCHDCGPMLIWKSGDKGRAGAGSDTPPACWNADALGPAAKKGLAPLWKANDAIAGGGVAALKGAGGYYLACSPFSDLAVRRLREIKLREEKPFAVMFPSVDEIRGLCRVSDEEERLLLSRARPIVLLEGKGGRMSPEVCRGSRYVGAFLPAIGFQHIMAKALGPLVMTSANLAGMPMIKDDGDMLKLASRQPLIDGVLYNRRKIRTRLDDSVVCVAEGGPQMIRRAKGYVPSPVYVAGAKGLDDGDMVFAAGGHLKSSFTLTKGRLAYMSQHLGDLENIEMEAVYMKCVEHMRKLFRVSPSLVVCDLHPLYSTTRLAEGYAMGFDSNAAWVGKRAGCGDMPGQGFRRLGTATAAARGRLMRVQHHHAHIASVMAEHGLGGPVIGVGFDGTGYGEDGAIWGGEFLLCEGEGFRRMAHLEPVAMPGGDSSMRAGWVSALSYAYAHGSLGPSDVPVRDAAGQAAAPRRDAAGQGAADADAPETFSVDISEMLAYGDIAGHSAAGDVAAAIAYGKGVVRSSSMGRLFDAVASLLDICHESRYEGECASMLEGAAAEALSRRDAGRACELALKFHMNVAEMAVRACESIRAKTDVGAVALSGGVFQNRILLGTLTDSLRARGFAVYRNVSVPCNDGGISLGQAYLGMLRLMAMKNGPGPKA
ncbi:MAG: carbamoyltransferase HypF [Clostridiales Family XIII bacterium]|jgi:hydrogenase maturation protein HypF|nr:carbamoyltransferase HypF [Clostridiales Family XIII bacterium]